MDIQKVIKLLSDTSQFIGKDEFIVRANTLTIKAKQNEVNFEEINLLRSEMIAHMTIVAEKYRNKSTQLINWVD